MYIRKKNENIRGTFGLILDDKLDETLNNEKIRKALLWLKDNNHLYEQYLANAERVDGYYKTTDMSSYYQGLPIFNNDPKTANVELRLNKPTDNGLIINVEDAKNKTYEIPNLKAQMGISIAKAGNACSKEAVFSNNTDTEGRLFPHLFPYGKGYYRQEKKGITFAKYCRIKLLNFDPRWRDDKYYIFYIYDRMTKQRLMAINNMIKARANLAETKNVENLTKNEYDSYYKYGSFVPNSILGSKAYWKTKFYELTAAINKLGNYKINLSINFITYFY